MFKNLLVYRLAADWSATVAQIEESLSKFPFAECGATQPRAAGWVSPRGVAHGKPIEPVAGQWLMMLMVESKVVPGAVVKRQVDALAARIEAETGRMPGRKQLRELKDQALLDLLPKAFAKRAAVRVWIAPEDRLLAIDSSSPARADEVLTALTEALAGFSAQLINTAVSPAAAMADWLQGGEAPSGFAIDRDCELKAADGEKPVVRYARHALDIAEVREHIAAGKQPTRLAMTWNSRISFVLSDSLQLRKIAFLDGVMDKVAGASKDEAFDTDAAIATAELLPLIADLLDALGGEQVFRADADAAAAGAAAGSAAGAEAGAAISAVAAATAAAKPAVASVPPWESADA